MVPPRRSDKKRPPVPAFVVERTALVDRVDAALRHRLTLVVAPPGYGKSTLLALWAAAHPEVPVAWLSLDRGHNHAVRFARSLVAALADVDTDAGSLALEWVDAGDKVLGEAFVGALLAEATNLPESVLAVENFDCLTNVALLQEVGALLTALPGQIHVVVSARSDPAIALHELRLLGRVTELRQDDLAFGQQEAGDLLRSISQRPLSAAQVDALLARTEGWPVGLQLAALSLRDHDDVGPFIEAFAGDDEYVADYLSETVLAGQPAAVSTFLLRTSVLDRMSAGLCDALTGTGDGQRMLEELVRRALFVVPLDHRRAWFRYHALFRDLLRYHLRASDPGLEPELLSRAARWHLERGEVADAAPYFVAGHRWDEVLGIVDVHGPSMVAEGEASMVLGWLEAVPDAVRAERSGAEVARALLHTLAGDRRAADASLALAEGDSPTDPGVGVAADAVRARSLQFGRPPAEVIKIADRALDALDSVPPPVVPDVLGLITPASVRPVLLISKGRAAFYEGDDEEARECLVVAAEQLAAGPPLWTVDALGALALLEAWQGNLTDAETLAKRALAVAREHGMTTEPCLVDLYLASGRVCRERGDLALAAIALDEGRLRALHSRRIVPLALFRIEAALLRLSMGEPHEGLALLGQQRTSRQPPPPARAAADLVAGEAVLLVAIGDPERAKLALHSHRALVTPDLAAAEAVVAVACRDVQAARQALRDWPSGWPGAGAGLRRRLWEAIVEELEGDHRRARQLMGEVVAEAEAEGAVRLLVDAGPDAMRLLRGLYHDEPTAFLRRLVDAPAATAPPARRVPGLVEQLTERELIVLRYLPSRLSNHDIAAQLFVSVNTLKTHLKHIYRKLDVMSRAEAVQRADSLGLL